MVHIASGINISVCKPTPFPSTARLPLFPFWFLLWILLRASPRLLRTRKEQPRLAVLLIGGTATASIAIHLRPERTPETIIIKVSERLGERRTWLDMWQSPSCRLRRLFKFPPIAVVCKLKQWGKTLVLPLV